MTDSPKGPLRYQLSRVKKHVGWARTEGVRKLIEEDQLRPLHAASLAYERRRWRRGAGLEPGSARAVFLVGVQRSGTNMMVRGLESCPAFEVRNENDRRAFTRFRLRDERVLALVQQSRQGFVLFKPLCDSHRVATLLDDLPFSTPPKAVWAYRDVDGRVRSSVAKFGDANRQALVDIATIGGTSGTPSGEVRWEAGGLSPADIELVRSLDPGRLSAQSASALFWFLRNKLFFEMGLDRRDDVLLSGYRQFVDDPEGSMRRLCAFLGLAYESDFVAHVDQRSHRTDRRQDLDERVRSLCEGLTARLDDALVVDPVVGDV